MRTRCPHCGENITVYVAMPAKRAAYFRARYEARKQLKLAKRITVTEIKPNTESTEGDTNANT